ncbi:MAG: hypothetical protein U0821_15640 [Chloroflexota bacterium]
MRRVVRRWYVIAGLAILVIVMLVWGGRSLWRLGHLVMGPPPPPRQTDVSTIAPWMTVPLVGRAFGVPPQELFGALGIDGPSHRTTSIEAIATELGRDQAEVLAVVRQTVEAWQATHRGPPPEGPPPDRPPR